MLSDGTGRLDIIDTGDRDGDKLSWRSVFSDLVCGQQKSFVVVGGEETEEAMAGLECCPISAEKF